MKTIILNDNEVEVDGIKYIKEKQKEPEFKVGQWIIGIGIYNPTHPARLSNKREGDHFDFDNNDPSDVPGNVVNSIYCRHCTPSEIESHLIEIAKEKGFLTMGTRFKSIFSDDGVIREIQPFKNNSEIKWKYIESGDYLWCSNGMVCNSTSCSNPTIYKEGKWAEIIPEKKKLPKTKEAFEKFCLDLHITITNNGAVNIKNFLDDYEL